MATHQDTHSEREPMDPQMEMGENMAPEGMDDQVPSGPIKEELIMRWVGPNRPFKKRDREFYTTVGLITFLVCLILFFANQFLPIALVISIAFVSYVLASVPPENVENVISNFGIHSGKFFAYYEEMGRFWFTRRFRQHVLHIEVNKFPFRMLMIVPDDQRKEVEELLSQILLNQEPEPGFLDTAAEWLQEKFPLDKDDKARIEEKKRERAARQVEAQES